jgi:outer membrane cobalamin receptor
VLCLFLLAAPARGEDAPPPGADGASGVPSEVTLDEVVVRLPRTDAAGPGSSASVVDAERFAGEAKSVAELVATAPGIAVSDRGGLGQLATASIRGSTADGVLVLLDGIPLQTAFGGGVDLSSIPRHWISSVEVVRGVEGARFGQGALGGAVNVVTRAAGDDRWEAQLSSGSFGTWSAGADGAVAGEGKGLLLSLGWDRTAGDFHYAFDPTPSVPGPLEDGVRANAAAERAGVLAKAFVDAGGGRLDAVAQVSGGRRGIPGPAYFPTPDDRQDDLRALGAARFARPVWAGAIARGELSVRYDTLDARIAALGVDPTTSQRGAATLVRTGVAARAGAHLVDLGLEAGGEELSASHLGETRRRATLAAGLADEVAILDGRGAVHPALRVERVGPFSGWSATLGAHARLAGPLSLRASAGRTFRAPSFAELYLQQGAIAPNPDLRPEEGIGGSAGLVAEGRYGLASATAFATLYRDLVAYEFAFQQRWKPFNAGKALVRGVELEAASVPVGSLRASGSLAYTLLASEILRGDEAELGNELPQKPRHRLFARAGVAPGPFEFHGEAQLVGRQFIDRRNLGVIPRALLFAAGASVRVARRPDVRLHVDVRNLLDDRTLQDGFWNPLPSRMVLLGLRIGSTQEGTP